MNNETEADRTVRSFDGTFIHIAGQIAKKVNAGWCGWTADANCIRFRIATIHHYPDGRRIWLWIGGCSIEYLELLANLDSETQHRYVERKAEQLRRFVEKELFSVPPLPAQ